MDYAQKNELKTRLVWVDLEMTGLDVDKCHILEIACLVTDSELNVLAEVGLINWGGDGAGMGRVAGGGREGRGGNGVECRIQPPLFLASTSTSTSSNILIRIAMCMDIDLKNNLGNPCLALCSAPWKKLAPLHCMHTDEDMIM